jgi:NADH-quinone oxidoreductase subunit G
MCGEGMDVWALGVQNRGVVSVIAPNDVTPDGQSGQLDCEQCGMCIDVCPVGALTSGSYRYKTRPWEMKHVSTVCTHCADGCKVTLGVRQVNDGSEIVRADNRDKSGINNDFLCAKGRFGFDFVESPERLSKPLVRNAAGKLEPATWEHALRLAGSKLKEIARYARRQCDRRHRLQPTTNEENYLLQKFARTVLHTNNIDHERTTDYAAFAAPSPGTGQSRQPARHRRRSGNSARRRRSHRRASAAGLATAHQRPPQSRAPLHRQTKPIKLERQARAVQGLPPNGYKDLTSILDRNESDFAKAVMAEESLVIIFGQEFRGAGR